ncbi:uncharacterized protein LOC124287822 [Haliotis rubra]|uniref:uncharacterized protein LOC124287822 n=1 Tax=Haliotis rubra TaxID=36100 RepID=UPI001EE526B8|nr:uncharacterized protein LOC124287822 [Haliotis rubra]
MKWSHIVLILTAFVAGLRGDTLPTDDEDGPDELQSSGSGQGEVPEESGGDIGWLFYFMICSGIAAGIVIVVAIIVLIHRLRRTQESRTQKPVAEKQKSSKEHV